MSNPIREILKKAADTGGNVLLTFSDGDIVEVAVAYYVDESIYSEVACWSGHVEKIVKCDEKFRKLFPPGSGMDFHESDLVEVQEIECKS